MNKDVSVMETDRYIIVKIPRPYTEKAPQKKQVSFTDLVGVLKDVPMFKNKTSVEVQHMVKDLWSERYKKHTHSS